MHSSQRYCYDNQSNPNSSWSVVQYFSECLPLPTHNLANQFSRLPPILQTDANYRILLIQNQRILQAKFNKIVGVSLSDLPPNTANIDHQDIVQGMCQSMRNQANRDYSYNQYANSVENYWRRGSGSSLKRGNEKIKQTHNSNTQFVKEVLNNLLSNYTQYYSVHPIPEAYPRIIEQQINNKLGTTYLKSDTSQNFKLNQQQSNSAEIRKSAQVGKNAQILQQIIRESQSQSAIKQSKQNKEEVYSKTPPSSFSNQIFSYALSYGLQTESQRINNLLGQIHTSVAPNSTPTMATSAAKSVSQMFSEESFKNLTYYQYHMLNHIFSIITLGHSRLVERNPYVQVAFNALTYAIDTNRNNKNTNFGNLQQQVNKQLNYGQSFFDATNPGSPTKQYYQIQSWMIVLIFIYKCVADNYDPYRRKLLKSVFQYCSNPDYINVIESLRWLENNRPEVLALMDVDDLISKASAVIFDVYIERHIFLKESDMKEVPDFRLINLSSDKLPRRKVVNIWVSGFLSQDMDKKSHWKDLALFMPDSQIYAVQWKSDTISSLVKFIGGACIDLLTADKMREELQRKYTNNPFIPAIKVAIDLGRYLAEMLVRLFPNQFINITGYSLGSEMIKSFMQRLIETNNQRMLNNVYMLGGVSDIEELQKIIGKSKYPWSIYNLHTGNDMVLKHILSLCTPNAKPIGINELKEVSGHEIINVDCSDFVSGHLSYMSEFKVVGRVLSMNKQ